MSKRLEQMRANPKSDWKIADVEALCREFGIECEPSRSGSSHYKVKHRPSGQTLTVPFKRPIKPVYIRLLIELIDKIGAGS
jgi:hypothetical protein